MFVRAMRRQKRQDFRFGVFNVGGRTIVCLFSLSFSLLSAFFFFFLVFLVSIPRRVPLIAAFFCSFPPFPSLPPFLFSPLILFNARQKIPALTFYLIRPSLSSLYRYQRLYNIFSPRSVIRRKRFAFSIYATVRRTLQATKFILLFLLGSRLLSSPPAALFAPINPSSFSHLFSRPLDSRSSHFFSFSSHPLLFFLF